MRQLKTIYRKKVERNGLIPPCRRKRLAFVRASTYTAAKSAKNDAKDAKKL